METVSFNAGWQTHGSGRNYASQTGITNRIYIYIYSTEILVFHKGDFFLNLRSLKYDRYEYGENSILFLQMQDL